MLVAIIDYGSGNLRSVTKAFERASSEAGIVADICLTSHAEMLARADRIVLPGVGSFPDCWAGLKATGGMEEALHEAVIKKARPFLGICVGAQLMVTRGFEKSITPGLDWIGGEVVPMVPGDCALKIPHIGWNELQPLRSHPILANIHTRTHTKIQEKQGWHAYFVHSCHLKMDDPDHIIAVTDYGGQIAAIIGHNNMIGTQFHPEKSQSLGLSLITNFLGWRP